MCVCGRAIAQTIRRTIRLRARTNGILNSRAYLEWQHARRDSFLFFFPSSFRYFFFLFTMVYTLSELLRQSSKSDLCHRRATRAGNCVNEFFAKTRKRVRFRAQERVPKICKTNLSCQYRGRGDGLSDSYTFSRSKSRLVLTFRLRT